MTGCQRIKLRADLSEGELAEVTAFHNAHFPPRTLAKNLARYRNGRGAADVVRDGGRLVGLLEFGPRIVGDEDVLVLETLLVDPAHRGRGLASWLLADWLAWVRPGRKVIVRFRERNKEALSRLYGRHGFAYLERDGAYKDGEPRWRMSITREGA